MAWLNNCRINAKFVVLICTVILGLGLAGYSTSRLARQALLDDRILGLKSILDIAVSTADSLDKRVQAGKLSKEQALDALRERLLAMAYDNGDGYIYAYTMEGITVSFPDPKLIGVSRLDLKLANGRMLVRELIEGARNNGAFSLRYGFPKPGQSVRCWPECEVRTGFSVVRLSG